MNTLPGELSFKLNFLCRGGLRTDALLDFKMPGEDESSRFSFFSYAWPVFSNSGSMQPTTESKWRVITTGRGLLLLVLHLPPVSPSLPLDRQTHRPRPERALCHLASVLRYVSFFLGVGMRDALRGGCRFVYLRSPALPQ